MNRIGLRPYESCGEGEIMIGFRGDNVALYERDSLWNKSYLEDPYYRLKVWLLKGMIPDGVKTILDVGCGNGSIANAFASRYWIIGGDRSFNALRYLGVQAVRLSADNLPFKDHSFDTVMSHQLLEHLPTKVFHRAIHELARVAKRFLLISVPYCDSLAQARACCRKCGCKYNVWGHLRGFSDVSELRQYFPEYTLRVHAFCGRENEHMTRPLLWVRQWLGGGWGVAPNSICPRCGSLDQYQAGMPRRIIAALADRLDCLIPKKKAFWWLVCLFERTEPLTHDRVIYDICRRFSQ